MAAGTRQRMVEAAAGLLRDGGLEAANFSDVLARSGAARGAIYHHFPQGKSELTRAAVSWTGDRVRANIEAVRGDDPSQVVTAFLEAIRPVVGEASGGTSCAVAAVVLEAGQRDATLTETAHLALRSWIAALDARLLLAGAAPVVARQVSVLLITFLEGDAGAVPSRRRPDRVRRRERRHRRTSQDQPRLDRRSAARPPLPVAGPLKSQFRPHKGEEDHARTHRPGHRSTRPEDVALGQGVETCPFRRRKPRSPAGSSSVQLQAPAARPIRGLAVA